MDETTLIPVRQVFTENQRTAINRYFKKYDLVFTKKKIKTNRCDMQKISKLCNCISLKSIDELLIKVESEFLKTNHIGTRETIKILKRMKKDIKVFLANK